VAASKTTMCLHVMQLGSKIEGKKAELNKKKDGKWN
jgi:hypothetical protein